MLSVLLFGIIASAWAAPQFDFRNHGPPPYFSNYHTRAEPYGDSLFDTRKFWADISQELREIDEMLADFTRHFPTSVSQEGVEGNEYKVTIPLSGFSENDIVVKARVGLLMIQANHKFESGAERNYLDIRTLPSNVVVNGTWTFDKSVLTIVFPLKEGVKGVETVDVMSTDITTRAPFADREEIDENQGNDNSIIQDADVGVARGDQGKETELLTNEIPSKNVEATTYIVDLKDAVEFVPVRY